MAKSTALMGLAVKGLKQCVCAYASVRVPNNHVVNMFDT